ncbi:MAG TPA: BON domain-containing protein [Longimicrobium sp.]|nr:BON domain-containing protein [Longimicrobium sp.]
MTQKTQETREAGETRRTREPARSADRPKRQNRQYVVELEEPGGHGLLYALGAIGGVAIGALLARGVEGLMGREAPTRVRPADDDAPAELRPGRLRRPPRDQEQLLELEDAVLDAFLRDEVLCGCGIDVGVISRGIVELSGSVWTREESHRAMDVARGVSGVETVVNRMEIEAERGRLHPRADTSDEGLQMSGAEWTGHQTGMGRRRQGDETDPARRDDSHRQREEALEQADRAQFADEGHYERPHLGERDEVQAADRTHYREDELDNQDPFGKHAVPQGDPDDGPPQAMNSQSRVGEGLKPGTELALEAADVPVKPHGHSTTERPEE